MDYVAFGFAIFVFMWASRETRDLEAKLRDLERRVSDLDDPFRPRRRDGSL